MLQNALHTSKRQVFRKEASISTYIHHVSNIPCDVGTS